MLCLWLDLGNVSVSEALKSEVRCEYRLVVFNEQN
jgi:hypothetical protein